MSVVEKLATELAEVERMNQEIIRKVAQGSYGDSMTAYMKERDAYWGAMGRFKGHFSDAYAELMPLLVVAAQTSQPRGADVQTGDACD